MIQQENFGHPLARMFRSQKMNIYKQVITNLAIHREISDEIAAGVAAGKLHPMTKVPFVVDQQEQQSRVKAPKETIIKQVTKSKPITQFFGIPPTLHDLFEAGYIYSEKLTPHA